MPKQETKEIETKKEEKKPEPEPQEFLQKVATLKYPYADVFGIVKVIARMDKEHLTLGFQDANGRKEICLTASKDIWKKTAQDLLDYIASAEKG